MRHAEANQTPAAGQLHDELSRLCLPDADRDSTRKLAWTNSLCILFLLIGIFGAKRGVIASVKLPPIEEIAPVAVEPIVLPPQQITTTEEQPPDDSQRNETAPVVVVTPDAPNINFAVPTIGSLVAPAALASPAPLKPLQAPVSVQRRLETLQNTGTSGDRPKPPYPRIALEQNEQGAVGVLITGDGAGNIASVELKGTSGSGVLDRATLDFIRRHWTLPVAPTNQIFETTITYQIQTN